jgi:hypothetical protein
MISFSGIESLTANINKVVSDIASLDSILSDPKFISDLRVVIAENYDDIWDSQGAAIGEDWNGRDLIQTGRLKASLTVPGQIDIQIFGDSIVFGTTVPYATDVSQGITFAGITNETPNAISELIAKYLNENGQADWR